MSSADKKLKIIRVIVILAALILVILPFFTTWYMRQIVKKTPVGKSKIVPFLVQVKGTISISDNYVVLTGVKDKKYILVGEHTEKLKKLKNKSINVFGNIMKPNPRTIEGKMVRFNIDVKKFGEELEIGRKIKENEFAKVKEKIEQKIKLKQEIIGKLNISKNKNYEVVKGTLALEPKEVYKGARPINYLILTDIFGDRYILIGGIAEKIKRLFPDYQNKVVVLLGEISLPTSIYPITESNLITFVVKEAYDENLNALLK